MNKIGNPVHAEPCRACA